MEVLFGQLISKIDLFFLFSARVGGLLAMAPVFNHRAFLNLAKVSLTVLVTIILFSIIPANEAIVAHTLPGYIFQVIGEFVIGLSMGFIMQLIFAAILTAGQAMDVPMGFGIVNVLDPQWGIQVPLTGNFLQILALLAFLAFNGHLLLLKALADSYQFIPLAGGSLLVSSVAQVTEYMVNMFSGMFLTALKLAMPIIGLLLITDLSLGIVARTVPQMNIFVVGMPVKIIIGIALLWVILPAYLLMLDSLFLSGLENVYGFLRLFRP